MIHRALLSIVLVAGLGSWLPSPASAQLQAPNRLEVVERVDAACPGLVNQNNGHDFTDAAASLLAFEFPEEGWGRNAKRGNPNDPSHDAIWYPNPRSPLGGSIVDIIGSAGGPDAGPAWIDQTAETIRQKTTGGYIRPSMRLPGCLQGVGGTGGGSAPPPRTDTGSGASVDLSPVLAILQRLEVRLAALESRPGPSLDLFAAYVDDMVGRGPADDPALAANHVTDVKQRLDVVRAQLEPLNAWLRSRSVFRF